MGKSQDIKIDTGGSRDFDKGHDKNNTPVAPEDPRPVPTEPKITGR